jgi:transcriptional regulator with XRE-family HTH domain
MRPGEYSRQHKARPGNLEGFNKIMGKRIMLARKSKGWSQSELADKVNVSQVTICRLENGHDNISLSKFDSVLKALGIDFKWEFSPPSDPI